MAYKYIYIYIYIYLPTNSSQVLNNKLSNCVMTLNNDIKEWIISNNLLLNSSTTTLLKHSPSYRRDYLGEITMLSIRI